VYVQDEWRATPKLTLVGGTRLDKSNQVDHVIASPRAGVRYGVTENFVARVTLSTGFRAPAVFDEDLHIAQVGGEGFLLQNSRSLREERSLSFTGGAEWSGRVAGRRFQLSGNFFRTDLRDAFTLAEELDEALGFRRLMRVNGGHAHVEGVSLDGNLRLTDRLALRGGWTTQEARWRDPEPQFGARDFFRSPNRYGFGGADWTLPGRVEVSGTLDFTGSMLVPHYAGFIDADRLERSKRFFVVNAVASRTFEVSERARLRLFANVQNMGDAFQPDLDRGANRDSAYVYGPSEMRRVVAGLTLEF